MKTTQDILLNDKLAPEAKVYKIASLKEKEIKTYIGAELWYAILELKNKHLKQSQLEDRDDHSVYVVTKPSTDGTFRFGDFISYPDKEHVYSFHTDKSYALNDIAMKTLDFKAEGFMKADTLRMS